MRCRYIAIMCAVGVLGLTGISAAEELAGKLERVGWETVTIAAGNNEKLVLSVDKDNRVQAAPYIGKRVTVRVSKDKGKPIAVLFKPLKPQSK